jgi:hypothetical protein
MRAWFGQGAVITSSSLHDESLLSTPPSLHPALISHRASPYRSWEIHPVKETMTSPTLSASGQWLSSWTAEPSHSVPLAFVLISSKFQIVNTNFLQGYVCHSRNKTVKLNSVTFSFFICTSAQYVCDEFSDCSFSVVKFVTKTLVWTFI